MQQFVQSVRLSHLLQAARGSPGIPGGAALPSVPALRRAKRGIAIARQKIGFVNKSKQHFICKKSASTSPSILIW
ncbi:hypothetical protein F3J16_03265 [Burkholderia sp. Ap-962]|uniref:hypothetical protein n=1 Tax=Burkholderia sp. Ap-962 TaxID=2608333 RepID=UPI00141DB511|nr:hypothetical protein [Burkholderia sp. Ap-962]NIF69215.1 hypothetical protein [Burkholderia sp. Ap-962]